MFGRAILAPPKKIFFNFYIKFYSYLNELKYAYISVSSFITYYF